MAQQHMHVQQGGQTARRPSGATSYSPAPAPTYLYVVSCLKAPLPMPKYVGDGCVSPSMQLSDPGQVSGPQKPAPQRRLVPSMALLL
eukprot:CAMPEP_0179043780 /NCGR_PEP_ID=MMETSP0796-20121207/17338_1 /TAXON_ID=73915 /ORGANISM="Pyrodinium bahamense, Strain pbaha01" /LENGTH=86 /DNA_ID=CAMNT_0020740165 /DNA_START=1863 /DNA_END=2123 /DNA_ORIENTATION=+